LPPRNERFFLEDVHSAIDRIAQYASRGREHFMATTETQDAIVRNLEIIGEASKRISPETRGRAPEILGPPSPELVTDWRTVTSP